MMTCWGRESGVMEDGMLEKLLGCWNSVLTTMGNRKATSIFYVSAAGIMELFSTTHSGFASAMIL